MSDSVYDACRAFLWIYLWAAIADVLHDIGISISGGRVLDEFVRGSLYALTCDRLEREVACLLHVCSGRSYWYRTPPHTSINQDEHGLVGNMHAQRWNISYMREMSALRRLKEFGPLIRTFLTGDTFHCRLFLYSALLKK